MYLSHYLARGGVCARRKAAELIKDGFVKVNDKVEKNPAYEIKEEDRIVYGGKRVYPQEAAYLVLNKPKGIVTTCADERNRQTVLDMIKIKNKKLRLYPVGRLDKDTTGLLVLTNDGEMAQKLAHPKFRVRKTYMAKLDKPLEKMDYEKLRKGVFLRDGRFAPDKIFHPKTSTRVVGLEIHSGKYRIIRRAFFHLGYEVLMLERVAYGPLRLKDLPTGSWRDIKRTELLKLLPSETADTAKPTKRALAPRRPAASRKPSRPGRAAASKKR